MRARNGWVGVEPFKTHHVQIEVKNSLALVKTKHELVPLKVVYGTDQYPEGTYVWVAGEVSRHDHSKRVLELEAGKPFFLLQETFIMLHGDGPGVGGR